MSKQDYQKEEEPVDELVRIGPNIVKEDHFFKYISGTEVMCTKCPLGYVVGPENDLIDGHIYIDDKLLI